MDSHNGISASGKLYGLGPDFATVAEECAVADEDFASSSVEELLFVDELLTAGVICCSLDDERITHIETSEELDSGTYRSI
jgi:hypothetical protein